MGIQVVREELRPAGDVEDGVHPAPAQPPKLATHLNLLIAALTDTRVAKRGSLCDKPRPSQFDTG